MTNPTDSVGEHIADGIVHVIGIVAGLVAVTAMMVVACMSLPLSATASLAVYGAAMLGMFVCSAVYHLVPVPTWKSALRRLDQAAIFLKIAGTYTPFATIKMGGMAGCALLSSVWTIALLGAVGKLLPIARWERTPLLLYLTLGWAGLLALPGLSISLSPTALALLAFGGGLYTIGVIFHLWRSLPYQNAIWHLFVGAVTSAVFL